MKIDSSAKVWGNRPAVNGSERRHMLVHSALTAQAINHQFYITHSLTRRCSRTRSSGRRDAASSMSSQVLIMALIVQHGFCMLGRVSGPVCDWVRFTSPVLCQPWDMGLVRDCFQIFVQHTLEGLSCASRGISDVLRKTIEQPGTLDREGGLSKCLYGWRGCGCDTRYMAFSTSPGVPLILYRVHEFFIFIQQPYDTFVMFGVNGCIVLCRIWCYTELYCKGFLLYNQYYQVWFCRTHNETSTQHFFLLIYWNHSFLKLCRKHFELQGKRMDFRSGPIDESHNMGVLLVFITDCPRCHVFSGLPWGIKRSYLHFGKNKALKRSYILKNFQVLFWNSTLLEQVLSCLLKALRFNSIQKHFIAIQNIYTTVISR